MPEQSYLDHVRIGLPADHPIRQSNGASSRDQRVALAYFNGPQIVSPDLLSLLQNLSGTDTKDQAGVCLIENISPEWIDALGRAWNIPPEFFIRYASSPDEGPIWDAVMHLRGPERDNSAAHREGHVDGVLEHIADDRHRASRDRFPRRRERHPRWGLQGNSKISYYRVSQSRFYLILTDLPSQLDRSDGLESLHTHLCLRVPFSRNRGGLVIPQLYNQQQFSALDCFSNFLTHGWHWNVLFSDHLNNHAVQPAILANILAASLWRTNIQHLKKSIHLIAFKDELASLSAEVFLVRKWLLKDVLAEYLNQVQHANTVHPDDALTEVMEEAEDLYQFLMDTFQLLIGSISVLDSQTSLEEAKRSTTLTQLAAVYLPLSLVTSIFGMNIKEINDSPLSVWVVFVALAIVALGTGALLLGTNTVRNASLRKMQRLTKRLPRLKQGALPSSLPPTSNFDPSPGKEAWNDLEKA